jgi:hypothetical protein
MVCRTRLICRFPARERRCRTWSPDEASIGAVPFQNAKWALVGNRVMSPTSTSSRAAPVGAYAAQVEQAGVGGPEQLGEFLVGGLLAGVDPLEVSDEFGGDAAPGLPDDVAGTHLGQQCLGLHRGQVSLRPAGNQLEQQLVQLGGLAGVLLTERAAAVDQDPQHLQLFVGHHRSQPGHPGPDECDRVRVGGVGLAALPGGEHPRACRQLGWDVDDLLTIGDQPMRDVLADPRAALDRPDPVRPLLAVAKHGGEAVVVGGEPAVTDHGLIRGHHLDRR